MIGCDNPELLPAQGLVTLTRAVPTLGERHQARTDLRRSPQYPEYDEMRGALLRVGDTERGVYGFDALPL